MEVFADRNLDLDGNSYHAILIFRECPFHDCNITFCSIAYAFGQPN